MSTSLERLPARQLPGDLAMWWFVLAELTVFGLLILAFAVTQRLQPGLFAEGRALLDSSTGLALTLGLLGAGLCAALAVQRLQRGARVAAGRWLLAAVACGGLYVLLKLHEYGRLLAAGLGLEHDTFFTLYWILTGFHFLHVLPGLAILGGLAWRCLDVRRPAPGRSGAESCVLYWHMVDLIWVLLYPLVYLLR
jgi:nitric oxide reductase NorE protein